MFWNGITAIEGLSGSGRDGGKEGSAKGKDADGQPVASR
jgi:hypothetical protein